LRRLAQKFDVPIVSHQRLLQLAHNKGRVIRKEELADDGDIGGAGR
jgi:hypothetical protein